MRNRHIIATLASAVAFTGQSYGEAIHIVRPEPGSIYHHTGFLGGHERSRHQRPTSSIGQRQVRKNRRRAHAAGCKDAFR